VNTTDWTSIVEYIKFGNYPKKVKKRDDKKNFKKKCKKFEWDDEKKKLYYLGTKKVQFIYCLCNKNKLEENREIVKSKQKIQKKKS
jgi:hypothetical protein